MDFVDSIPTDTILPGQGFNTISARPGGQTVEYSGPEDLVKVDQNSDGMQVTSDIRKITTFAELKERMKVGATASAGFGIFNGDATSTYIRGKTFTEYGASIFIDVTVLEPARVLKKSLMTTDAITAAKNGMSRFLGYCGNVYCYGLRRGGQFTAIADFSANSLAEHEKIITEASGVVEDFLSGKVTFERSIEKLSAISNFSMTVLRKGPKDSTPTMTELAEYARTLPERVAKGGGICCSNTVAVLRDNAEFPI